VLQALGELTEARDLFRSALASIEQIASPGHLIILVHQSKLARVLLDLGELSEARDMLRSVLASAEKCYPQNDPSFARHQFDLAMVLKDLGELTEARDLLNHAYDALLNLLGADHPDTKTVKHNLDSL
jgi:tetratricopeptide (TPR) repeat protein